jgi:hypothetical protein
VTFGTRSRDESIFIECVMLCIIDQRVSGSGKGLSLQRCQMACFGQPIDQHPLNESDSRLISRSSELSAAEKTIAESDLCVRYGSVPLINGWLVPQRCRAREIGTRRSIPFDDNLLFNHPTEVRGSAENDS